MVLSIKESPNMQHLTSLIGEDADSDRKIDRQSGSIGFSTLIGTIKYHALSTRSGRLGLTERDLHNNETHRIVKQDIKDATIDRVLSTYREVAKSLEPSEGVVGEEYFGNVSARKFRIEAFADPRIREVVGNMVEKMFADLKWETAGAGRLTVGDLRGAIAGADKIAASASQRAAAILEQKTKK